MASLDSKAAAAAAANPLIPKKEFHLTMLGKGEVGKTSLCQALQKKTFSRKKAYKASLEEAPVKYTIECLTTNKDIILLHLFDWCWEIKKRELTNLSQQLMFGKDGVIFCYSCEDRPSHRSVPSSLCI